MATSTSSGKRLRLTVFLVKDTYPAVEDFLSVTQLNEVPVTSGTSKGTLYFKSGFKSQPPCAAIFADVPGFNPKQIVNQGSRAIYVSRIKGRWFCFTFGYTRHLIDESAIERNFGLIVSLNLGDPRAIKAIDKTNISHVGLQSREQAGRDVGFEGFEFDTDIDLLKSITAKSAPIDGEIDKITQERDASVVKLLDEALVQKINQGEFAKIWLAIPEILNWEEIDGFSYRPPSQYPKKAGPVLHPDIDLESWLAESKLAGEVSLENLCSKNIFRCMKDGTEPATWKVYRCLNAEIDLKQKKYILNDGDWYNVDGNYVKEIEAYYANIPASSLALPKFGTKTEPTYLAGLGASHPNLAVMDRKLIMIGNGKSRVEFCDLYSKSLDIVHVKKYGGSSVLSHLFNQAVVSAECFLYESTFRDKLNHLLPVGFKLSDTSLAPVAKQHIVCLAIMSKVKGPLEIPFFSKVSLRHAVKALRKMDFKVTKLKIER